MRWRKLNLTNLVLFDLGNPEWLLCPPGAYLTVEILSLANHIVPKERWVKKARICRVEFQGKGAFKLHAGRDDRSIQEPRGT